MDKVGDSWTTKIQWEESLVSKEGDGDRLVAGGGT